MCLAAISIGQFDRFPLVLAANRDEYLARPTAPVDWWTPRPDGVAILSGRDLEAGGTWLGLGKNGRLALLTNVREPARQVSNAPSRGGLVTEWLESSESGADFWQRQSAIPYNGYNLIAGDVREGRWFWGSNRSTGTMPLMPGLYGLSNAELDTPWPKLVSLKQRLASATERVAEQSGSVQDLAWSMFVALADKGLAPDDSLPSTGVPKVWEKALSATFIDAGERGYGTRCSTVVVIENVRGKRITHVFELSHATDPMAQRPDALLLSGPSAHVGEGSQRLADLPGLRHVELDDWPAAL
ncbi:NRDE family protein [soil metagenome]